MTTNRTVAYLKASTINQDAQKNKADILAFANNLKFGHVEFFEETVSGKKSWKERMIKEIIDDLEAGHKLIVPELSRLGRSILEIMEILSVAKEKEISIYSIKGNWELNGTIQSKLIAMCFSMAAEIERDLRSARTNEALSARESAGGKLDRPKGRRRSKLDPFKPEIEALLANGSTKTFIAKRYDVTMPTFYNWLNKNDISY